MKRILSITVSVLLSALILVNGTGLIIGKMTCLESGHVIVKTGETKDCCNNEPAGTALRNNCCTFNHFALSGGHFIPSSIHFIKSQIPVVSEFKAAFSLTASASPEQFPSSYFSPPENSNPDFLCVFRI